MCSTCCGREVRRGLRESPRLLFLMGTDERKPRRGDKTPLELFLTGVQRLEERTGAMLCQRYLISASTRRAFGGLPMILK
jgi:hypothetical protein